MPTRRGLISYDGLPVSSGGGHGLGRLRVREAWNAAQRFFSACTTATEPHHVLIGINDLAEVDPVTTAQLRDAAIAKLGVSRRSDHQQDYGDKGVTQLWELRPALVTSPVDWLSAAEPLAPTWLGGPATVQLDFQFRLRSADGAEIPYQRSEDYFSQIYSGYGIVMGESVSRLRLSARSSISIVMFIPFEEPNDEFQEYARFLQGYFPVRFSKHHWAIACRHRRSKLTLFQSIN
jgi:hypothetical protein